jgi:hypothetical protein
MDKVKNMQDQDIVIEAFVRLAHDLSVVFERFERELGKACGMLPDGRDPRIPADISRDLLEMDPCKIIVITTRNAEKVWESRLGEGGVNTIEHLITELLDEKVRSWPGIGNTTLAEVQSELRKLGVKFIPAKCFKKW